MIRWLRALLGLHEHNWKTIAEYRIEGAAWDGERGYVGILYVQQCETCGAVTKRKITTR